MVANGLWVNYNNTHNTAVNTNRFACDVRFTLKQSKFTAQRFGSSMRKALNCSMTQDAVKTTKRLINRSRNICHAESLEEKKNAIFLSFHKKMSKIN